MKILTYGKTHVMTCDNCGCKFEYEREDTFVDDGYYYVSCPNCKCDHDAESFLTRGSIQYPEDFHHYGKGNEIDDADINDWVKQCIKFLDTHPDKNYYYIASGNSIIFAFNEEDGIDLYVCKDY